MAIAVSEWLVCVMVTPSTIFTRALDLLMHGPPEVLNPIPNVPSPRSLVMAPGIPRVSKEVSLQEALSSALILFVLASGDVYL